MRNQTGAIVLALMGVMAGRGYGEDVRGDFLKMIDRPLVPLAVEVTALPPEGALAEYHFTYASDAGHRVPGILVESKETTGRRPVVIALHGTGGNKSQELRLLRELAGKGFVAVAIEDR